MLLLGPFLLPAVLLWASPRQGQTTSPMRNPLEGAEIFDTITPLVMELTDEVMDQPQLR